jgi:hypothetical protein
MTFGEIVTLACTKLHRTDVESRDEMKVYVKARYQMIWDSRPWKDTLRVITLEPTAERHVILPPTVDRIICVRWGVRLLDPDHLVTIFLSDPQLFDQVTAPHSYSIVGPSGVEVAPAGEQMLLFSDSANANFIVTIHGMLGNVEQKEQVAISGANNSTTVNSYDEVFGLAKDDTTYGLTVKNADTLETLLELWPAESSRMHQRIMLHTTPGGDAQGIFILYKRRCNDLVNDSDAIQIRGIDNPLLAAGIADMLEAQRHYGKAQLKAQESGILAQAAADLDVHQQANMIRLIPWDSGEGGEGLGGKGYL